MRIDRDLACETRDGVELAVNVYRPESDAACPALVNFSPYGKELQEAVSHQPKQPYRESTIWDGGIEAGDIEYIIDNGYALVSADCRGSNASGGTYRGLFDTDAEDGYDLVEWTAERPWCDGQVGMAGRSWLGTNQLLTAAERPPSLIGIFASGVFTDLYREFCYEGGILNLFQKVFFENGIVANDWVSEAVEEMDPGELDARVDELMEDPDIQQFTRLHRILHYPFKNPLLFDLLVHDTDDEYYAERSPHATIGQIDCPVHLSGAWAGTHTRPTYSAYEAIDAEPLHVMMTPPRHLERPYHEYKEELIRWFDALVHDEGEGVMDEPPVKLFISGRNRWRFEDKLIPDRTEWRPFYLRNFGRLLPDPEVLDSVQPSGFVQEPPAVNTRVEGTSYLTKPFSDATEITGPLALNLFASIDSTDTTWICRLRDIGPGGDTATLSRGYLRASHRRIDESRSEPYRPYHPHVDPEPVEPGVVYEYNIEFSPIGHEFGKDHRLEVEIRSMELPSGRPEPNWKGHHLPSGETIAHKIYQDSEYSSHVLLPFVGPPDEEQWIEEDSPSDPGPTL